MRKYVSLLALLALSCGEEPKVVPPIRHAPLPINREGYVPPPPIKPFVKIRKQKVYSLVPLEDKKVTAHEQKIKDHDTKRKLFQKRTFSGSIETILQLNDLPTPAQGPVEFTPRQLGENDIAWTLIDEEMLALVGYNNGKVIIGENHDRYRKPRNLRVGSVGNTLSVDVKCSHVNMYRLINGKKKVKLVQVGLDDTDKACMMEVEVEGLGTKIISRPHVFVKQNGLYIPIAYSDIHSGKLFGYQRGGMSEKAQTAYNETVEKFTVKEEPPAPKPIVPNPLTPQPIHSLETEF